MNLSLLIWRNKNSKRFSIEQGRDVFSQVLAGITYWHQNRIAHRDIKLENILVWKPLDVDANDKSYVPKIKIVDFGFAVIYESGEKGNTFWGTPSYMAPEIIKKIEYDYELVDVWALGVLFFVILTGYFPFKGASNKEIYLKIIKGNYVIPERIPINPKRIIMKMLQVDPAHRRNLRNISGSL